MFGEETAQKFPCPKCGAEMDFDAERGTLACAFCGHTSTIPVTREAIQEYDLEAALKKMIAAPHEIGYGDDKRSIKCESCGAINTVDANVISTECAFCGSNQVVPQEQVVQVVKPESLLPFQVDRSSAVASFRDWLGSGFFRPTPVKKIAKQAEAKLQGTYLPFWTFDAYTSSWWQAEAGYHYFVTEHYSTIDEKGNRVEQSRQVQKTRWEPVSGFLPLHFDDVLVPASASVERTMIERIYPFDTSSLVPYEPGFLSGWGAEAYTVDLSAGWKVGQDLIQGQAEQACARQVPGDTHRNLRVDTAFSNMKYKHVLFPVWIASYDIRTRCTTFSSTPKPAKCRDRRPLAGSAFHS